jgi:hypothetical protein
MRTGALVAAAAIGAIARPARAEPARAEPVLGRPQVLTPGAVEVGVTLESNLDVRMIGTPLSLAPDVRVGVLPRLTLAVLHSARALGLVTSGDGICLGGVAHGCGEAYRNLALDARWAVRSGPLALAAHAAIVVRRFEPLLPALRLGARVRWRRDRFEITADPYLQLGLWHRDQGNRAVLGVPLWFAIAPTCRWSIYVHTGPRGEVAVLGDAWALPLALGTRVAVSRRVDVAGEAGFERLGGPLNTGKLRSAWLAIDLRWP